MRYVQFLSRSPCGEFEKLIIGLRMFKESLTTPELLGGFAPLFYLGLVVDSKKKEDGTAGVTTSWRWLSGKSRE
jgi:hypothetical protein